MTALKNKIRLGSVSEGTMRKEDLIPCFIDELLWHDPQNETGLELQQKNR